MYQFILQNYLPTVQVTVFWVMSLKETTKFDTLYALF
jgi:hypothetical protein